MKRYLYQIFTFTLFYFLKNYCFSQSSFELNPNKGGLLIVKKNDTEKNQILNPSIGLIIYNTTNNKLNVFNGTTWETLVAESSLNKKIACNIGISNYSTIFNPGYHPVPYDYAISGLNDQFVFNTTQYYFEAPISGVYQINCNMSFKLPKTGVYYISLQNTSNTSSYGYAHDEILANRSTPLTLSVSNTVKLTSGQRIYPQMYSSTQFTIDNGAGASFSAHLVYQSQ